MVHFLIVEEDELLRDALGAQLTLTARNEAEVRLQTLDLAALAREVADCGRDRPAPRRQRRRCSRTACACGSA